MKINHQQIEHFQHFARIKPGTALFTAEEEETNAQKWKPITEEQPVEDGWKISGTVKDQSNYVQLPFVQEIVQVYIKYQFN